MKKTNAFTLAEMLIAVLMISIALVVMAPVMTKKAKEPPPQVKIIEGSQSLPVGAIILWYGEQVPEGWAECNGQSIDTQGLEELAANVSQYQYLPDLNQIFQNTQTNLKWIIRVKN